MPNEEGGASSNSGPMFLAVIGLLLTTIILGVIVLRFTTTKEVRRELGDYDGSLGIMVRATGAAIAGGFSGFFVFLFGGFAIAYPLSLMGVVDIEGPPTGIQTEFALRAIAFGCYATSAIGYVTYHVGVVKGRLAEQQAELERRPYTIINGVRTPLTRHY